MPEGISIHIGLNSVDPAHYAGWSGPLAACEFDAKDMQEVADARGFASTLLLTADAKAEAVTDAISRAAETLSGGDMLFISYSGHGGQVPDGNSDEDDRRDETWCLYDRELVDDELYTLWSGFQSGVRVFVLSDSCHSGTAARQVERAIGAEAINAAAGVNDGGALPRLKALPEELEQKVYDDNSALYDAIQSATTAYDKAEIPVHVLLISGCQDNQTSADGDRNGLFTQALRQTWDDGGFEGDYRSFHKKIVGLMPLWQVPNYFWAGEPSRAFEQERPFQI